jgi:lipopolysaccharide transport system ATP-binding protein
MSDLAIRVENISKKYILAHQVGGRSRYVALRDVLAHKAKSLFQKNRADASREEFWALKDVSFDIKQGEAVGIIGRNGAGKSTLLKILSRITKPTKGRIEIEGRVASLLEVGTGFHPELTGRENIFLNGAILGMHRVEIKKKFDEIVAFAEVEKFLDTPVKRFSSGMYMRLAFAVAAHLEPEILIVDEVLAVGDAEFQKKCLGKMQDVSQSGRTVLFVSHNMDAIMRMCSRCILLGDGAVLANGNVRDVMAQYIQKKANHKPVVDLIPAKRQWEQRLKARFTSIRPISNGTQSEWDFAYGATIGFKMEIEVSSPLSHLEIGQAIFTAAGVEITAVLSSQVISLDEVNAGSYFFTLNYPKLQLVPGSYYGLLIIKSGFGGEDFIPRAFDFEILPSELSSQHKVDSMNGILVPEIKCRFEQHTGASVN